MREPVSKQEWKEYFRTQLAEAKREAEARPEVAERLRSRIESLKTKLWLLDFDVDTWAQAEATRVPNRR
jgi:hypothetical protein